MIKSNLKTVKVLAIICVALCVLYLCYAVYNCIFREYRFLNSPEEKFLFYAPGYINSLIGVFIIVFNCKILRHLKTDQLFVPYNYRWLIYAAVCCFVEPLFIETWIRMSREIAFDWSYIPSVMFKPCYVPYMVTALMLYLFACLYRIGELAAEEQRLTI